MANHVHAQHTLGDIFLCHQRFGIGRGTKAGKDNIPSTINIYIINMSQDSSVSLSVIIVVLILTLNFQFNLECISAQKTWKVKEITHDLIHDFIFHCRHNPLSRSMFRVLEMYNFESRPKQKERQGIWEKLENMAPFHFTRALLFLRRLFVPFWWLPICFTGIWSIIWGITWKDRS